MASKTMETPKPQQTPGSRPTWPLIINSDNPPAGDEDKTNTSRNRAGSATTQQPAQPSAPIESTLPKSTEAAAETTTGDLEAEASKESEVANEEDDEYSEHSSDFDSDDFTIDEDDTDEIGKAVERKNRLYDYDKEGVLRWLHDESSYTPLGIKLHGQHSAASMYDSASPEELQKYVRDHHLPDPFPSGLTLKYYYIRMLEQADKAKSFRFLDMPAEMRNLIYARLLTFGRCTHCPRIHEACHTGILRANKQIYQEARDILYGDNEIRCIVAAVGYDDYEDSRSFSSCIHIKDCYGCVESIDKIFLGMSHIPDWFRRIQCLRVDVDFDGGSVGDATFGLQASLLNLASFLMDDHCLKKLTIVVNNNSVDGAGTDRDVFGEDIPKRLDAAIYPLRRLRGIKSVEITGVSRELAMRTAKDMQKSSGPAFNTLQHLNNLLVEAKAYKSMVESIDPENFGRDVPPGYGGHLSNDLELLLNELGDWEEMDEDYDPFANAESEANTRRKMEELRDCLAKIQFTEFDQRRKDFIKFRKARRVYQSKSEWVYVDGEKKESDRGLRRDWEARLDVDDFDLW